MKGASFAKVIVIGLAMGVASCDTSKIDAENAARMEQIRADFPEDLKERVYDFAYADQIAEHCPRWFKSTPRGVYSEVYGFLYAHGVSNPDVGMGYILGQAFGFPAVQQRYADYFERRGIVTSDKESWCAAGRAEVAEGTAVSRYLIRRW